MRKMKIGLAVAALAVAAAGCAPSGTTGSAQSATAKTQAITYTVEGKNASNITYTTDGAGSSEQQSNVKLPFTKTVNVPNGFAVVSVMAQNGGLGSIKCKITKADGTVLKEAKSDGQYAIASCSGSAS